MNAYHACRRSGCDGPLLRRRRRDLGANGVIGVYQRPLLLADGDGVACFCVVGWQEYPIWSYTRDGRWTEPQRILGNEQGFSVAAGAALGKSLFLALGKKPRLLRLDGERWVDERPPFVPTRLSVAGNRLIGLGVQDKRTILMSIRSAGGVWSKIRTLATGDRRQSHRNRPSVNEAGSGIEWRVG